MTPIQRRRVHSGFYRRVRPVRYPVYMNDPEGMRYWIASHEWWRERMLDRDRKRRRRGLKPRRKTCFQVPCPPWQEMTLSVLPW